MDASGAFIGSQGRPCKLILLKGEVDKAPGGISIEVNQKPGDESAGHRHGILKPGPLHQSVVQPRKVLQIVEDERQNDQ